MNVQTVGKKSIREMISQATNQYLGYVAPVVEENISTSKNTVSIRDMVNQIKSSYVNSKAGTVSVVAVQGKDPKLTYPMSQEQMAVALALDMSGKKILSRLDRDKISTELYASIRKLVFQLASRYSLTCLDSTEDLVQDCLQRMLMQLWRFNPSKAKFTTWTWYICRSVLNDKYGNTKKFRGLMVDAGFFVNEEGESMLDNVSDQPTEGVQHHDCPGMLAVEMMDAVRELVVKYPEHKMLIFEMLGDPDANEFIMPNAISLTDAAKAVGVSYSRARSFFSKVIRPFYVEKFAR
jgi:DNA-directed RNA polymerase specialized sigma24 family protein